MHFGQRNGFISSIFFCHFFIFFFQIYFTSSSPTSNIHQQKRHFLLPSYLFKTNEQPKRQIKPTVEMVPIDAPPQFDQSLDVPANIFPVRKVPKEPFAMRPCYFSPIQCLLHTPEHDRKFQNYPEFQQNAYSRGNLEQMPSQSNANNVQINPSNRVKAAIVEALLAQKQLMGKKVKARRMLRQSEAIGGGMEEDGNGPQRGGMGMGRQRLFGNPWRRGL